jgi:hypothetical protein
MVAALQQKERDLILAAELGKVRPHPVKTSVVDPELFFFPDQVPVSDPTLEKVLDPDVS